VILRLLCRPLRRAAPYCAGHDVSHPVRRVVRYVEQPQKYERVFEESLGQFSSDEKSDKRGERPQLGPPTTVAGSGRLRQHDPSEPFRGRHMAGPPGRTTIVGSDRPEKGPRSSRLSNSSAPASKSGPQNSCR